jgi:signal transduction histidine kinase
MKQEKEGNYSNVLLESSMKKESSVQEIKQKLQQIVRENSQTLKEKIALCKQEEEFALQLQNEDLLCEIYLTMAELYKKENQFSQALYHFSTGLEKSKERNPENIILIHNEIAMMNWFLGHYDSSLESFQKVYSYWKSEKNIHSAANALCNIGTIYNRTQKYDEALRYFEESLQMRTEIGDKKGIAIAFNNMGIAYEHKRNFEKALTFHNRSLEIKKELNDERGIAVTLCNIGEIYYEHGDLENAIECCHNSLQFFKNNNDMWKTAYCHNLLGKIYVKKNQFAIADKELKLAVSLAEQIAADDILKMGYESLSELYEKENEWQLALQYFKLFSETKDKIINENSEKKMLMLENKFEVERAEKEAAIFHLKNIELAQANQKVKSANEELQQSNKLLLNEVEEHQKADAKIRSHQEHLQLINKILRHDLTNNLAVLKSAVNLFERSNDIQLMDDMKKYINKSISLIRKMREMEKLISENQNLKSFEVSEVIAQVSLHYSHLSISQSGKATILADERIFSIFDNIISNAIRHGKTDKIEVKVINHSAYTEIRIFDFGLGIPEQIMEKVFDENFAFGETGQTGLGLHIVKKSMEAISGGVFVEKNEPHGCVFVLLFRNENLIESESKFK